MLKSNRYLYLVIVAIVSLAFFIGCTSSQQAAPPPPPPASTTTIPGTQEVSTPTFSPAAGSYEANSKDITISTSTSGASIYYTLDGSTPTTASTLYTTAIHLTTSKTIKAIAVLTGYTDSAVASATFDLYWWQPLISGGNNGVDGIVVDALVYGNGNLYVGGNLDHAGGNSVHNIARWSGTTWFSLGDGFDLSVMALALDSSGNLYAGGDFGYSSSGAPLNCIAQWNGQDWREVGAGLNLAVWALAYNAGVLYAGGDFNHSYAVVGQDHVVDKELLHIASWDGSTWSQLGNGISSESLSAPTVDVLVPEGSGSLYVGGYFTIAAGNPGNSVAKWNSSTWSPLGSGVNDVVRALALDGSGNLYAGGDFSIAGGNSANKVAKWNNSTWSPMGSGMNSLVWAMVYNGGYLYVGGAFTSADGNQANYIARWNGTVWSTLGSGFNGNVHALAVDGSGNIYAGGAFTTAGGVICNNIAKWGKKL